MNLDQPMSMKIILNRILMLFMMLDMEDLTKSSQSVKSTKIGQGHLRSIFGGISMKLLAEIHRYAIIFKTP